MRILACLALLGMVVSGCKSSSEEKPAAQRKKGSKRPPKLATLYVESKGEPVNAGGRKVERSDAAANSKGSFSAKDLLMPGMFLLVSGVTTAGGALLIKAVDRKERPEGPTYVAAGGAEGTFVAVDTPPASAAGAPAEAPAEAPDPGGFAATGTDGESESETLAGAGAGVVSTPSGIIVSVSYSMDFTGPSYVKVKSTSVTTHTEWGHSVVVYSWNLGIDRDMVDPGTTVDVFGSFTGLPAGKLVEVRLYVPDGSEFKVEHTPLVSTIPPGGLGTAWCYWSVRSTYAMGDFPLGVMHTLILPAPATPEPVKLGHLVVNVPVEITGESTATITSP